MASKSTQNWHYTTCVGCSRLDMDRQSWEHVQSVCSGPWWKLNMHFHTSHLGLTKNKCVLDNHLKKLIGTLVLPFLVWKYNVCPFGLKLKKKIWKPKKTEWLLPFSRFIVGWDNQNHTYNFWALSLCRTTSSSGFLAHKPKIMYQCMLTASVFSYLEISTCLSKCFMSNYANIPL